MGCIRRSIDSLLARHACSIDLDPCHTNLVLCGMSATAAAVVLPHTVAAPLPSDSDSLTVTHTSCTECRVVCSFLIRALPARLITALPAPRPMGA